MSKTGKIRIIDAHHHLWNLSEVYYPWLMAKGVKRFFGDPSPIQKNYLVDDLLCDAKKFELAASVHIQVGAENDFDETNWVYKISKGILPSAHIAAANLEAENIDTIIEKLKEYPIVRGVRQIIGRHPIEDAKNGSDLLIDNSRWKSGLKALENTDLSFDMQLIANQYERMFIILSQLPELKVAICHFASPWQQDRGTFKDWYRSMALFATLPNIYMKFSGFSMFNPDWTIENIKPYVISSLELFGADRCMVGSNFPVDGLHRPYNDIYDVMDHLVQDKKVLNKLYFDNANKFYRLGL